MVSYRQISKIARAENAGASKREAIPAIVNLVKKEKYSVQNAYTDTVENSYSQKDLILKIRSLVAKLDGLRRPASINEEVRAELIHLQTIIDRVLKR